MASGASFKHLVVLVAVPLSIAAATGLAAGPNGDDERVDDHTRPERYNLPTLPDELAPIPSAGAAEYPLAVDFNPADPSNYTPGGIISHDYVVVHTMQGYYYGAQSWFQNPDSDVSAHFCMRSEDGEVTQMVYLSDRAWHVGNSNAYSIGIEHEGFVEEPAWYTWAMYTSSALLSRWIADEYAIPLTRERIVGHSELPNQTHTDPGINWNWDLYMALILDVVGEGRAEGYVVDRSKACTITATSDTWIKKTLEASGDLSDTDKCFIPAGTELEYLHASGDMVGHRRLTYESSGHPCEGFVGLDTEGYMFAGHFTATCDDASLAAAGVTVVLDGGAQVVTDQNGYFDFIEVGPGPHTLDVLGNGSFVDTLEPIDSDSYPGVRSIIAVDPIAGPGDGDGDPAEGGECWLGAEGCPCTDGGGCDPGLVCDPTHTCVPEGAATAGNEEGDSATTGETGEGPSADGIDYLEGDSCSVTDERPGWIGFSLLGVLGLLRRKRSGSSRVC
jgi:MYXO-CTERM domain-containing protein